MVSKRGIPCGTNVRPTFPFHNRMPKDWGAPSRRVPYTMSPYTLIEESKEGCLAVRRGTLPKAIPCSPQA